MFSKLGSAGSPVLFLGFIMIYDEMTKEIALGGWSENTRGGVRQVYSK